MKNVERLLTKENFEIVLLTKVSGLLLLLYVVSVFLDVGKICYTTYAVQFGLKWKKLLATLLHVIQNEGELVTKGLFL